MMSSNAVGVQDEAASVEAADGAPQAARRRASRLLFLYDAQSGHLAAIADSFKKLLGGGCPLCAVTHGLAGPRRSFLEFEAKLSVPVVTVHTNELEHFEIDEEVPIPCILAEVEGSDERVVLLGPSAIARLRGTPRDLGGRLAFHAAAQGLILPERESSIGCE